MSGPRPRISRFAFNNPLSEAYKRSSRDIDPEGLKRLYRKIEQGSVMLFLTTKDDVFSPAFIWKEDPDHKDKGQWQLSQEVSSEAEFSYRLLLDTVKKPQQRGSIKQSKVAVNDNYGYIPSTSSQAVDNKPQYKKEATPSKKVGKVKLSTVPKNKQATVKKSVEEGYALTNKALASLKKVEAGDKAAIANYEQYFGKYSKSNYAKVKKSYTAIKGAFEKEMSVKVDDKSKAYAYVYPGGKNEVFLGKAFWGASSSGFDSKGGVFVHELAHEVAGAKDIVYGNTGAKALAKSKPLKAITNADNYEYYAESL